MNRNIALFLIIFLVLPLVVFSITNFTIEETEKINLAVNASDPDNDNIAVYYSYPLDQNGEWQTAYGDAGQYKATITISDGTLNTSRDVLIAVKKREELPKIESYSPNESILNIKEGDSTHFSISAIDIDKDQLSYTWIFDGRKVKDSQDYEYDASYDDSGTHEAKIEVSDGLTTVSRRWTINVEDVARPPVFDEIGNKVINENQTLTIELNAVNPDGDKVAYSADNMPEGARLDGNLFIWTPSFGTVKKSGLVDYFIDKFGVLNKNFYVQFAASSGNKKVVQNVVITVKYANRAPVLEDIQPITVTEGQLIRLAPVAYDQDDDKVSLAYAGLMSSGTYQTKYGDSGDYFVKVTASDGRLETSQIVPISILKANRAPVLDKIDSIKIKEGSNIAILLNAYDPDNDQLNYSIENPPANSVLKGDTFYWTPGYGTAQRNEVKKLDLVFKATDGKLEARQAARVEVADANRAPRIVNASGSIIAAVNEPVLLFVNAVDDDNDPLAYTWNFGFFDRHKATQNHQRIFKRPGFKVVRVTVSDGLDSVEQIINVNAVDKINSNANAIGNKPPRITDASKNVVVKVNEPALLHVNAVDDDNDPLTYIWDFGFFDRHKATAYNLRTFTTTGEKTVKVTVSDGAYKIEYDMTVYVVE